MRTSQINGLNVLIYPTDGPALGSSNDALDAIGATYGQEIDAIAIPASRFSPDFFRLRTGLAGEFIQKFQNYGLRLAVVGDVSGAVAASDALRDFIYETNKVGRHLFVADEDDLGKRLKPL